MKRCLAWSRSALQLLQPPTCRHSCFCRCRLFCRNRREHNLQLDCWVYIVLDRVARGQQHGGRFFAEQLQLPGKQDVWPVTHRPAEHAGTWGPAHRVDVESAACRGKRGGRQDRFQSLVGEHAVRDTSVGMTHSSTPSVRLPGRHGLLRGNDVR